MNSFIKTLTGSALAAVSIYAIGRVAFELGRDYERLSQAVEPLADTSEHEEVSVPDKSSGIFGFGKKLSSLKDIFKKPEEHKFEASIEGDATVIRIRKKPRKKQDV